MRSFLNGGIHSLGISSVSSTAASFWRPRNPSFLRYSESGKTCHGTMWLIIGKRINVGAVFLKVTTTLFFESSILKQVQIDKTPMRRVSDQPRKPQGFWNKEDSCRQFLADFAREKGFDVEDYSAWAITGFQIRVAGVRCWYFSDLLLPLTLTPTTGIGIVADLWDTTKRVTYPLPNNAKKRRRWVVAPSLMC